MRYWIFWLWLSGAGLPQVVSAQVAQSPSRLRTDGFYYCAEEDRIQDTEWHNNKPLIFSGSGHFLLSIVVFYPDGGSMFDFWELPRGTVVDSASLAGALQKGYGSRFVPRSWGVYTHGQDTVSCIRAVGAAGFQQYLIADLFRTGASNTLWGLKKVSRPYKGRSVGYGKEVAYTPPMEFKFVRSSTLPQEHKPKRGPL